jgi:D-alanine-D-alanine ligase
LRIAVVHTARSPCRCHEYFLASARALGHRCVDLPVEELFARRAEVAAADVVVEHVDRYRGRADLRALVRHLIESWGGNLAGASAAAAQVADDKIEARRRLEAAGVPVAPLARGRFPAVVKRPFEHGSRGVALVRGPAELARAKERWKGDGTLLVEAFVEGRELAVAVLEGRVLPIVEVKVKTGAPYGEKHKWGRASGPSLAAAELPSRTRRRIEALARRAFEALALRDYARFDLRLDARGEPRFLEGNARPSVEDGTEFRLAAALAGLEGARLAERIFEAAARRRP